jgi:hypothetical protein
MRRTFEYLLVMCLVAAACFMAATTVARAISTSLEQSADLIDRAHS